MEEISGESASPRPETGSAGYSPQPVYPSQSGELPHPGEPPPQPDQPQPAYRLQPGYPAQPAYPPQPGYPAQPDYPPQAAYAPQQEQPPVRHTRRRRLAPRIVVAAIAAVGCAVVALTAGSVARAELSRQPHPQEIAAAVAIGAAQTWERVSAGTIFPDRVAYTTNLLTQEHATRLGIEPATDCASALDSTLSGIATLYHCHAALRASYTDDFGGTVYTVGVLAFPAQADAASFYAQMPAASFPAAGLHALAMAGTASTRFADQARQVQVSRRFGPYVVLVVGGYADGRAAAATGERRPDVFAPGAQLAAAVLAPLAAPVRVNCGDKAEWSC